MYLLSSITALAIASFVSKAVALPAPATVTITLIDATQHEYTVYVPTTKTWTPTNVIQSISHVRIENDSTTPCVFFGVDGVKIVSFPDGNGSMQSDVGPPQTIVGGICGDFSQEDDGNGW